MSASSAASVYTVHRPSPSPGLPPIAIRCRAIAAQPPPRGAIVYLPGLLSTWGGLKGQVLEAEAAALGLDYLSLHYQGHGEGTDASSGAVDQIASLEEWILDVEAAIDSLNLPSSARLILVGSSLGAWLAAAVALRRPAAIGGLVLLAPAFDGSRRWQGYPTSGDGLYTLIPSNYLPEGVIKIRREMVEDASARWLLLEGPGLDKLQREFKDGLLKGCPVAVLAGEEDEVVPVAAAAAVVAAMPGATLEVMAGGDHRLSRPEDLERLAAAVRRQAGGARMRDGTTLSPAC